MAKLIVKENRVVAQVSENYRGPELAINAPTDFDIGRISEYRVIDGLVIIPIDSDSVVMERSRRLSMGFDYDFGDERGVHRIGTTEQDMRGWDEVTKWAQAKLALGQIEATITIVTDTGPVTITPNQWFQIIDVANDFRQPIWAASFALQAMNPVPINFRDDMYWTPG